MFTLRVWLFLKFGIFFLLLVSSLIFAQKSQAECECGGGQRCGGCFPFGGGDPCATWAPGSYCDGSCCVYPTFYCYELYGWTSWCPESANYCSYQTYTNACGTCQGTKNCYEPLYVSGSCNSSGRISLSFDGGSIYTQSYHIRIDETSNNGQPGMIDGWYLSNPPDLILNSYRGNSYTYQGIPGKNYSAWVHPVIPFSSLPLMTASTGFTCPAPAPTASISQSTASTLPGVAFTVTWGSTNATSCSVTKRVNGGPVTAWASGTSGSQIASPTVVGTHVFTNTCTGSGGSASNSVTHTVIAAPTAGVCGTANGRVFASTATGWSPYTICSAGTPSPASPVFPAVGSTTLWTCLGQNGGSNSPTCSASRSLPAPTLSLTADSTNLAYNTGTTLRWTTTNASSCWGQSSPNTYWNGWKTNTSSASSTGNLTASTTYTMECWNSSGVSSGSRSVTVNVAVPANPSLTFFASPTVINQGQSSTLAWNTTSASSCTASGPAGWAGSAIALPSSSRGVSPSSTATYNLTCYNVIGNSVSSSAQVCVRNCDCAALICSGSTCSDGCGGACNGLLPAQSGTCGSASGEASCSKPTTNLCGGGSSPSAVTLNGANNAWVWTCSGVCGGLNASCTAKKECPWYETID